MNTPVVELADVGKRYGGTAVVSRVSLSCGKGEVIGLVGHNGAGKSTLFKMMLGIINADEGKIRLFGETAGSKWFRDVRRDIGYLPENVALYDNLSGLETLQFFARLKFADPRSCASLLDRVGLGQAMHRAVREYSKGMRQRLGFAQALLGNPRLLLLDEPTNGLDPEATHAFYDLLGQLKAAGTTVILSSHLLAEIQSRVDRLLVMAEGRLVARGTVAALTAAAKLPASVQVSPRGDAVERVFGTLVAAGFEPSRQPDGRLQLALPPGRRIVFLRTLAWLADALLDYSITEATLEDVFLQHLRGTPAREGKL